MFSINQSKIDIIYMPYEENITCEMVQVLCAIGLWSYS